MTENSELLRRYLSDKSEAAFTELVRRNVDLVYSAALRQVGGDPTAAEDVTQAVFTDLARKAPSLARHTSLTGWLYTSTRYVATKTLRAEHRRRAREEKAFAMTESWNASNPPEANWEELRPVIDEAMHELNAADRDAVLMRFFESRPLAEIGARLGLSENAARMRVDRALDKLREVLAKRGVSSTSTALATVLAAQAVTAAPAGLASKVTAAAFQATASAGFFAAFIAWLAGVKTPVLVGGAAAALLFAIATVALLQSSRPPAPSLTSPLNASLESSAMDTLAASQRNPESPTESEPIETAASSPDGTNKIVLNFVEATSGKPVPGVIIDSWMWHKEGVRTRKGIQANRIGLCEVPVERTIATRLTMATRLDGFADTRIQWLVDRGEQIPETFTVRLGPPVKLAGRVVDADGNPVQGAEIGFNNDPGPASEGVGPQTDNFGWPFWITASTDAEGRWFLTRIAAEATRSIYGGASHPEHVQSPHFWANQDSAALKQLLDGTHVFRLGRAATVRGIVLDPEGRGVADATVRVGHVGESGRREARAAADGSFVLTGCKPGENLLTAEAEGFAAATLKVVVMDDAKPFKVVLQPGRVLRLRVVNQVGQAVSGANVWLNTFEHGPIDPLANGAPLPQVEFNRKTDAEGRVLWEAAPEGELSFDIAATGYMRVDRVKVRADGVEHVVTLPPALTISGTVRDAGTGEPVPKFQIISGWPQWTGVRAETNAQWSTIDRHWLGFSGGAFRHVFEEALINGIPNPGYIFKFEAEGYAPHVTRAVGPEEGSVTFDVLLTPTSSKTITVLLPDGHRALHAHIGCVVPGTRFEFLPGGLSPTGRGTLLASDKKGEFKLPPDESIQSVIAAHEQGFVHVTRAQLEESPVLQLQPWGRLEGSYRRGSQPISGSSLICQYEQGQLTLHFSFASFKVITDAEGRFAWDKLPPGKIQIVRLIESPSGARTIWLHQPLREVDVEPGQTARVQIDAGTTVHVRVTWSAEIVREPGWQLQAMLQTPTPTPPRNLLNDVPALQAWQNQPQIRAAFSQSRHYPMRETRPGVFVAEDVPPGEYVLMAALIDSPTSPAEPARIRAHSQTDVNVPGDAADEGVDLGEIRLTSMP